MALLVVVPLGQQWPLLLPGLWQQLYLYLWLWLRQVEVQMMASSSHLSAEVSSVHLAHLLTPLQTAALMLLVLLLTPVLVPQSQRRCSCLYLWRHLHHLQHLRGLLQLQ